MDFSWFIVTKLPIRRCEKYIHTYILSPNVEWRKEKLIRRKYIRIHVIGIRISNCVEMYPHEGVLVVGGVNYHYKNSLVSRVTIIQLK